jgi:hypothetical protein
MLSCGGKLIARVYHLTKNVSKAEELTFSSQTLVAKLLHIFELIRLL